MTPEEAAEIVDRLRRINYSSQAERNEAAQIIRSLQGQENLPPGVTQAVGDAFQKLQAGGGVADTPIDQFRKFRDTAAGVIDQLGVFLGVIDELNTVAGRRYIEALVSASVSGDPAALRRLDNILQDEKVNERSRMEISNAVERVTRSVDTAPSRTSAGQDGAPATQTPTQDLGAPGADAGGIDPGAPLGFSADEIAAMLAGSGQSRFYGVPEMTGDEEGGWVPWEAIVGEQSVAPRYPTGWSLQPQRFGLSNEESIARAQILMEEAGLLQPGSYRLGVWDVRTAGRSNEEGWRGVLSFANVAGLDWEDAFSRLYDAGTDAAARGLQMDLERLSRTPYFEDPEKLRARARSFLRSMGRRESEIMDDELDGIVQMAATGAQQSQMEALTQRVERQSMVGPQGMAAAGALTGGDMPAAPLSEPQLDPLAHFDNALRQVMGREIESREAQEEARTASGRVARTAGMIGSAR